MAPHATRRRGLAASEVTFVVSMSVLLAVGLSAILETPRQLLLDVSKANRVSMVDRAIRQLDDDVRFAKDVSVPGPERLLVSRTDGGEVAYRWDGAGRPLLRAGPEGAGPVLAAAERVRFTLASSEIDVEDGGVATVPTSVLLTLHVFAGSVSVELEYSFPIANNLAMVNR